jgi:adenine deaminase
MNRSGIVKGVVYNPILHESFGALVFIENGKILKIERDGNIKEPLILPGFIDSHVHIESSMLTPAQFGRTAAAHGTVAAVADPHEIANVAGVEGINFMLSSAIESPIKLFFGAPSCVPASPFDECFQPFSPGIIKELIDRSDIFFLGEMMNFPGVIGGNAEVMEKINIAKSAGKPIDGHAPSLDKNDLKKYISAGISTDHESFSLEEAIDKLSFGMKVIIREGSAAKNFDALHSLIPRFHDNLMFCTDDCHPDDLIVGHINKLVKKAINAGYNIFDILQVSSVNPVMHYNLNVGLLQPGDPADFIVVDGLSSLNIISTYINGDDVLKEPRPTTNVKIPTYTFPNSFDSNLLVKKLDTKRVKVIDVVKDELITNWHVENSNTDLLEANPKEDLLKIAVVSRYKKNEASVGLIRGFGINKGAIAASIAHDSHHIIAIGCDDNSITQSINYIVKCGGGICYFDGDSIYGLPLPAFGLMTNESAEVAGKAYHELTQRVIADGCKLQAPFMTMSFMSLSVIPHLKITPTSLFDVDKFSFTNICL